MIVFKKIFGGRDDKTSAYLAGQQFFQQGMQAASEYRTAAAIALYTKSFETNPNPAPLINRAKLYRWRLLFTQAIHDLEAAMRLDKQQGDQFSISLGEELRECKMRAQVRLGGKRDLFLTDLQNKGFDYISGRIVDSIFEGNGQLLGYLMIDEVDNIKKFETLSDFPTAKSLVDNWMRDQDVIDQILSDQTIKEEYKDKRIVFESMVSVYDYPDMAKMRDTIIRKIWCLLNPAGQIQSDWEVKIRSPIGS